jgi:hypothetical protein
MYIRRVFQSILYFYFSRTGNSFYIAKSIDAKLRHIKRLRSLKVIEVDVRCFVFPSYDFKSLVIVSEIIIEASVIHANYVVAVKTYGVAESKAQLKFKKTLKRKRIELNSGFGVKMPHNAIGSMSISNTEDNNRIKDADTKVHISLNQ